MIRERHGVMIEGPDRNRVDVYQREPGKIRVVCGDKTTSKGVTLTPEEARYIAAKLRRLARMSEGFVTR